MDRHVIPARADESVEPPLTQPTTAGSPVARRRVAQGAAWVVPVIVVAAAAPMAAASPCSESHTFSWGSFVPNVPAAPTAPNTGGTIASNSGANIMTVSTNRTTGMPNNNLRVSTAADAGFPGGTPYLEIAMPLGVVGSSQTVTFSFSAPVSNLSFTIGDIDSDGGAVLPWYHEGVYMGTAPTTAVLGAAITGTGTSAATAWHGPLGTSIGAGSSAGNVTLTYAGPLTTLTLTLVDLITSTIGAGHSVDVFNLTYVGC